MDAGGGPRWVPVALVLVLAATSLPVLADRLTVHVHDEDAILVGESTGTADVHLEQGARYGADAGTYKTYEFEIAHPDNRLAIDLGYDPGPEVAQGPCLRANDLDLYVDGPGWDRAYPGCDDGDIAVLGVDVPLGEYTVRVDAEQGSTICLPDQPPIRCPDVEYVFDAKVWAR